MRISCYSHIVAWDVDLSRVWDWYQTLDDKSAALFLAAVTVLREDGPQLGRPLVDSVSVKGSRHQRMKELRPGSQGRTEIRALFVFDPQRRAIVLLAGDKSGQWEKWYKTAIPRADDLFDAHMRELKGKK